MIYLNTDKSVLFDSTDLLSVISCLRQAGVSSVFIIKNLIILQIYNLSMNFEFLTSSSQSALNEQLTPDLQIWIGFGTNWRSKIFLTTSFLISADLRGFWSQRDILVGGANRLSELNHEGKLVLSKSEDRDEHLEVRMHAPSALLLPGISKYPIEYLRTKANCCLLWFEHEVKWPTWCWYHFC